MMNSNYVIIKSSYIYLDHYFQNLGADVRVFESVGRMFLLTDIKEVRQNLVTKIEKSEDKIKQLQVSVLFASCVPLFLYKIA